MWGYPADGDPVVLLPTSPPTLLSRSEERLQRSALRRSSTVATWTWPLWKRTSMTSCDPLFSSPFSRLYRRMFLVEIYSHVTAQSRVSLKGEKSSEESVFSTRISMRSFDEHEHTTHLADLATSQRRKDNHLASRRWWISRLRGLALLANASTVTIQFCPD